MAPAAAGPHGAAVGLEGVMAFRHEGGPHAGKWEVEGRIVGDTGKALLLELGEGRREWLPKRWCAVVELRDGVVAVLMHEWVAKAKGFA